jgi:quercetin dioxygenase-like cupin family protein
VGSQGAEGVALVEHVVVAGSAGPPLHMHPSHAEGFYVLAGELTFQVGDEMRTARAGAILFCQRWNSAHVRQPR